MLAHVLYQQLNTNQSMLCAWSLMYRARRQTNIVVVTVKSMKNSQVVKRCYTVTYYYGWLAMLYLELPADCNLQMPSASNNQ